jgi:Tfp pilus assembly protein PilO
MVTFIVILIVAVIALIIGQYYKSHKLEQEAPVESAPEQEVKPAAKKRAKTVVKPKLAKKARK